MKKILAESYPKLPEKRDPLPAGVLAELTGKDGRTRRRDAGGATLLERLAALLRGPQLAAVGAVAVLVVAAIVLLPGPDRNGQAIRSGGGTVDGPAVVVLAGLTAEQVDAVRASGYFRAAQLVVVAPGETVDSVLAANRQANLIVVDGTSGWISAPHATGDVPVPVKIPPGDLDLPAAIQDFNAALPAPQPGQPE